MVRCVKRVITLCTQTIRGGGMSLNKQGEGKGVLGCAVIIHFI